MPRISKSKQSQIKKTAIEVSSFTQDNKINMFSRLSPKNIILLVLLVLIVIFWKFKGNFIAAVVNNQPISRFELNDYLVRKFGSQALDNIINERLILAAARQKGIFVTSEEINSKIKQIEEKLKGQITLAEALKMQGLTENDFKRQVEIQLSIDKLFDKEASISTKEIDEYIASNSDIYKNEKDKDKVQEEVKSIIRQQKISDLFNKWFEDIRKNANIKKYL